MAWTIDGTALDVREVTATHRTVSVSGTVLDVSPWRQYDRVGDYQVPVASDGSFRAIDRSGGSTVTVTPASSESPPFKSFTAYVSSYEEQQAAADRAELSLTFQRAANRSRQVTDPAGSGAWTLALSAGTIGLSEQQVLLSALQGSTTEGEWTLPVLLEPSQAEVVVASLSHVDAVAKRPIADAGDDVVDVTADDRNTVTLTGPSRATLSDGDYVTRGWTLRSYSQDRWRVDLPLSAV